jgi:hypothetical protein
LWGVTERRRENSIHTNTTLDPLTNSTTTNQNEQTNFPIVPNLTNTFTTNNESTTTTTTNNNLQQPGTTVPINFNNNINQTRQRRTRRSIRNIITRQQILTNNTQLHTHHDTDWGDPMPPNKPDNIIRIGFRNINGIPHESAHSKNIEIISDIRSHQFDTFSLSETNVAWHVLQEQDRIAERFRGKFEFSKFSCAYNADKAYQDKLQYGGVLMIGQGNTSGRIIKTGRDPSPLGRWSWMLLKGKDHIMIRIVTIYRPVISQGALSTYQQHQLHYHNINVQGCPRIYCLTTYKNKSVYGLNKAIA